MTSISGENTVAVVDIDLRKVVYTFVVGREPRHMDITPDGRFAYIAVSGGDYVGKVAIQALTENRTSDISSSVREIRRIHMGEGSMPYSVSISPNGRRALSANNQVSYVSLIDLENDRVLNRVDIGTKGARGSVFSPDSARVFVTIEDSSEIVAISSESGEIEKRFPSGPGPRGIIFDAETNQIFASAFTRTQGNQETSIREMQLRPNSVSILGVGEPQDFVSLDASQIDIQEISVGSGPCSVTLFTRE